MNLDEARDKSREPRKLHITRWLYSLTYERGTISMIQRRKYDTIVNIKQFNLFL